MKIHHIKGFTLVEIMIVVAIVAILAVIVVPNLMRTRLTANHTSAITTLKAIGTSLEQYSGDNGVYPNNTNDLINTLPAYIKADYFNGVHSGYTYAAVLSNYDYTITATPQSTATGTKTFVLTTGSKLSEI